MVLNSEAIHSLTAGGDWTEEEGRGYWGRGRYRRREEKEKWNKVMGEECEVETEGSGRWDRVG